ncbi:MAG: DinB family protein [Candidatus Heimdallarchaeota archaeon]
MNLKLLTEFQIWGNRKVLKLLETLTEDEYYSNLGENIGSIHHKCAHIVSVYDFFIKIFEDEPFPRFRT